MAVAAQKQPAKRRDPAVKRVDRTLAWGALKNADPAKKYVYVNKADQLGGIGYYENIGYEIETKRDGGPVCGSLRKGTPNGSPIEFMGHVLMSIDKEEVEAQDAEGMESVIAMQRRILGPGAGEKLDDIRGIRGRDNTRVLGLENKTSDLETELE